MVLMSSIFPFYVSKGAVKRHAHHVVRHQLGFDGPAEFIAGRAFARPGWFCHPTKLALALPDQDHADGGERGAVSGPFDLPDTEAPLQPLDHPGPLSEP